MNQEDKICLITGTSSGIGYAIAQALNTKGYKYGRCDYLFNCAGTLEVGNIVDANSRRVCGNQICTGSIIGSLADGTYWHEYSNILYRTRPGVNGITQ